MVGGIGGNIQYSGGTSTSNDGEGRNEILKWTGEDWVEVGKMYVTHRYDHAVSTIRMDDYAMQFCG